MPIGSLVSLPQSLSRSGTTLINLRGIVEGGQAFNYITQQGNPSLANISRVTSSMDSNSSGWTSTIQYAFEPDAEGTFSYIDFGKLMSADTSFTILFRVLMKNMVTPNAGWIFTNGDIFAANGYAILNDPVPSTITLAIFEINGNFAFITLNSSSILTNQWYHYGIRVTTSGGNTIVNWWENGGAKQTSNLGWEFVAPASGGTKLMNEPGNYSPFYGKLTDFVFLNGTSLTDSQMVAFATAPFV